MTAPQGWLNLLIECLQASQYGLLQALHALGLAGDALGQPAWPWAQRLSGDNLLIDLPQARRLGLTVLCLACGAALLLAALFWRRRRVLLIALGAAAFVFAPWPQADVVFVPATPASFQHSPTGFTVQSIDQGAQLYARHCTACHGADGLGYGPTAPLAAMQPVWPPSFSSPLLWRRADGDLLWHILYGVRGLRDLRDPRGRPTMAGFHDQLDAAQAWALIDYLKAQAAGQMLRATGAWPYPIALPDMPVRCAGQPPRPLSRWRGQRVRLAAIDATHAPPPEDPRLVLITVAQEHGPAAEGVDDANRVDSANSADCQVRSGAAWRALALIAGTQRPASTFAGTQLLSDRQGWLRARASPGQGGWSPDDLVCRAQTSPQAAAASQPRPTDGLGALIERMDAEPVRFVKGGSVH